MAKYDFMNVTPYNEQPLYKQGYEDASEKALALFDSFLNFCTQNGMAIEMVEYNKEIFRKELLEAVNSPDTPR